jgi:hypothetical protein
MDDLKLNRYSFNPSLLEINGRIWMKRSRGNSVPATLSDIDKSFYDSLQQKNIDYLWLMGAWQNSETSAEKYCLVEELQKEYSEALPDWNKSDVIGSPYAIDDYSLNKRFGTKNDLLNLRERLNSAGIRLILDFVPNHFSAESKLISSHPEIFLEADEELLVSDESTFFRSGGKIFAHGKDPYFAAWQDTIQVNYFNPDTYEYLLNVLQNLAELCDGIRCDMAMLPLLNVFANTWSRVIKKKNLERPEIEFWEKAIKTVKAKSNNFIFIAEAYWDLEYELQKLGFDFTYDKRLTDRLINDTPQSINAHFKADYNFQSKSVRFLENHDEKRAIEALGQERSKAAAIICSTLPGMRFYHDGQFEGRRVKLPVQLGREPFEEVNTGLEEFYDILLPIAGMDVCKFGRWELLEVLPAGSDDHTYNNVFSWLWYDDNEIMLAVINYSDNKAYCRLRINFETDQEQVELIDLMDNNRYNRNRNEITSDGLFIQLEGYQSHIFLIKK